MLASSRAHHTRQQPSISKPMPVSQVSPTMRPVSPPTSPSNKGKSRRPSVSSPMTWLSRASSSASIQSATPYAPSRPVRISEPRFANPVDALTAPRSGVLGAGATVVRTPQEALAGPRASASSPDLLSRVRSPTPVQEYDEETDTPGSPPLPPIPDNVSEYIDEDASQDTYVEDSETIASHPSPMSVTVHPPPPNRPPPSLPHTPDMHVDAAPMRSTSPLRPHKAHSPLDCFPAVPPLPAVAIQTPPQAPFSAILVSIAPSTLDASKIIVSLETSTATHKAMMSTLTSRPSHFTSYLLGLLPSSDSDAQSVYSTTSDVDGSFNSIFHHHLATSGVLQASTNLHIFLDRPSAPYTHVLAYLRSLPSPEHPATLPHAVRLNGSPGRLEALLELRDEASYLGLEELHALCVDELRHRQPCPNLGGLGLHMRGFSNASTKSLHTLRETSEPVDPGQRHSGHSVDSGFGSNGAGPRKSGASGDSLDAPWPSPPSLKQRLVHKEGGPKKDGNATSKARPTGTWI
ncbi:hypothetical protein GSI_00825 [Ganoderma sinense ZZ0214-1]|uniref:BTB domain-containing protein n=1 Tax=Ganoderma sinense ZZ0214-1 TaxID=1077348 RepID=A0A2G8STU7_9APHY|nr:hypothetical protein GSI_00825 [Ganoderma sinense ZZ0214-1]